MQQPLVPPDIPYPWEPMILGTIADSINIVLGVLSVLVAFAVLGYTLRIARRQIQIMDTQTGMMATAEKLAREQVASAGRQEMLALELAEITRQQGKISENLFRITLEQLSRRPQLQVSYLGSTWEGSGKIQLGLANVGQLAAASWSWSMWSDGPRIEVADARHEPMEWRSLAGDVSKAFIQDSGIGTIFPGQCVPFLHLEVPETVRQRIHIHVRVWHEGQQQEQVGKSIVVIKPARGDSGERDRVDTYFSPLDANDPYTWRAVDNPSVDNSESTT